MIKQHAVFDEIENRLEPVKTVDPPSLVYPDVGWLARHVAWTWDPHVRIYVLSIRHEDGGAWYPTLVTATPGEVLPTGSPS